MEAVFNGINGAELVDIACARLRRMLEDQGEFTMANVFPCFDLTLMLELSVYPRDNPKVELEMQVSEKQSGFRPGKDEKPVVKNLVDRLEGVGARVKSKDVKGNPLAVLEISAGIPPDQVRAEHGLPVSRPQDVPGVGYVDKV